MGSNSLEEPNEKLEGVKIQKYLVHEILPIRRHGLPKTGFGSNPGGHLAF